VIDGGRDALEAVDLAPGRAPAAEVALEPINGCGKGAQLLIGAGLGRHIRGHLIAACTHLARQRLEQVIGPEDGEAGRHRVDTPARIPAAERRDRLARRRFSGDVRGAAS
jgi:hypothetical protein